MGVRVYEYGALAPAPLDLVEADIRGGHRYQNTLVEIERWRRAQYRAIVSQVADVAALESEREALAARLAEVRVRINAGKKRSRSSRVRVEDQEEARRLRAELAAIKPRLKEAREAVRSHPAVALCLAILDGWAVKRRAKAARAARPCSWGTGGAIEQAVDAARAGKTDPRFRRWDGHGRLAVQLQRGLSVEDAFGGADTRLRIAPVDPRAWDPAVGRGERKRLCRTTVQMRIGTEADRRTPIWVTIPIEMHRPIPEDGRIKWAYLVRDPVADHVRWRFQLAVESPEEKPLPARREGVCAIDVGWRLIDGELRVGYLVDDTGHEEELRVPAAILGALHKAEDLRSIRDRHYDGIRARLREWLAAQPEVPEWLREATATMDRWRSPGRLVSLRRQWHGARIDGDEEIVAALDEWYHRDRHLWQWEAHQRRKTLGRRKDLYRVWAADIASRYARVVVEDFDLRATKRRDSPEEGTRDKREPFRLQTIAASGELRIALQQTCGRRGVEYVAVPSAYTTLTCHGCGTIDDDWDPAGALEHTCSGCGRTWDQDANAARNLLARAQDPSGAPSPLDEGKAGNEQAKRRRPRKQRSRPSPQTGTLSQDAS